MAKKLKIYFACAIRGEQGGAEDKECVVNTLKKLGHTVLSEIFLGQDVNTNELGEMNSVQICDRDLAWVEDSDLVVAEVTRLSHGVGFELGWAAKSGKRAIILCHKDRMAGLSNMLLGAEGSKYLSTNQFKVFEWSGYKNPKMLEQILEKELGKA